MERIPTTTTRKTGRGNSSIAQTALAGFYARGVGVAWNFATAAAWFRRTARQGDPIAQLNLGELYASGRGVGRDLVAAWVWTGLAARAGNGWARNRRDAIARDIIVEAGYGDEFGHSLGHGVGLEVHEYPRVGATSEDVLEDGMVFTIEPGIYLPEFGVRSEIDVFISKDGPRVTTEVQRKVVLI